MDLFKGSLGWLLLLPWVQQVSGAGGFLIKNVRLEKCLHTSFHETAKIGLAECKPRSPQHQWGWDAAARAIVSLHTQQCLTALEPQELALAQLEPCGSSLLQAWVCSKKGHLTLAGLGLHLSTKPGGHKAFLSPEKDKFSRWRTLAEETVCTAGLAGAPPAHSNPAVEAAGGLAWARGSKATVPPEASALSVDPTTASPTTVLANITSTLPTKKERSLGIDQEKLTHHKKHAGNQRKTPGSRHPGTNWKTVMLVLCPLAFILGLIILALNIHYNKKKKMLYALKSRPDKSCKVGHDEELLSTPGTGGISPKTQIIPASPSPSLKHGEILIEWKDGTITPLFDNMNYQIC
ncbi:uncharacterized protein LOC128347207 isoform X2 [Hemicordylus capensis]|uniref:uncharacterized protein LOC128347207 isoform X2 n=1 Tax=Hemicordylus capensis TaxID=884348 RepID=UPI0023042995|nr:uncharacterized protein LOC128347207 isoform X2 [Hemicordylus capensis]